MADFRTLVFKRHKGRTLGDRNVVTGEFVRREQFANFKLDELEQLFVIDLVDLVQEHHKRRNTDLTGKQDVLAGLGHRAVGSRNNKDRAVHLGSTGDHVLHIVSVARAIDVRIVALFGLVFDVRRRNGDPARLFFRRLVDLVVRRERRPACLRQNLRDRCCQRRLAMVNVTNRADVAVRLVTRKFFLAHCSQPLIKS